MKETVKEHCLACHTGVFWNSMQETSVNNSEGSSYGKRETYSGIPIRSSEEGCALKDCEWTL